MIIESGLEAAHMSAGAHALPLICPVLWFTSESVICVVCPFRLMPKGQAVYSKAGSSPSKAVHKPLPKDSRHAQVPICLHPKTPIDRRS